MSGMTEGLLWVLCHALTPPHPGPLPEGERETGAPLSFPPAPLCHARRSPSVMPAGLPLSCPLVPLCHARRLLAGIQCFFCFLFVCACMGKPWIPD